MRVSLYPSIILSARGRWQLFFVQTRNGQITLPCFKGKLLHELGFEPATLYINPSILTTQPTQSHYFKS